jgi:DNA-binding HxlR family transcriptional regulator
VCGIADALGLVGERWALLVLREIGFGVRRFGEIRVNTGAPRETLATRLRELEAAALIERRRYRERPPRDEYLLTEAGRAIEPVLRTLREWGERYAPRSRPAPGRPRPDGAGQPMVNGTSSGADRRAART